MVVFILYCNFFVALFSFDVASQSIGRYPQIIVRSIIEYTCDSLKWIELDSCFHVD